jgi:hypothetical protein
MTWETLSQINVNDYTEKKGDLTFLPWAWAWKILMEHYPDAVYQFEPNEYHPDNSVTVYCTLTVEGITRPMWLPVMDNRNNAISKPTSRQISDTKMRCLVKAIAMFGLGSYIYAGEDLPENNSTISEDQVKTLKKLLEETRSDAAKFCSLFKVSSVNRLLPEDYDKALSALNNKKEKMK